MQPSNNEVPVIEVVPVKALLTLLIASVGVAWWLVPSQQEMMKRMLMDKENQAVTDNLRSQLATMTGVADLDLADLSPGQFTLLTSLMRMTQKEQQQTIFLNHRAPVYDRYVHAIALGSVRYVDVISPRKAWEMVQANSQRMSGVQMLDFAKLLAKNALATSEPELAASILEQATQSPIANVTIVTDYAQACRWSDKSGPAAQRLLDWLQSHEDKISAEECQQLTNLVMEMGLESGQPTLALEASIADLKRLPEGAPISEQQLQRSLSYAQQCGKSASLWPWLNRYVSQTAEHQLPWQELSERYQQQPESFSKYRSHLQTLANFCDWSSQFDLAYDMHYRLAAMGELCSLDRCVALENFLGRSEDLSELLTVLGSIPERPNLQIKLANMLAENGNEAGATSVYTDWLTKHPEDKEASFDLACLMEDMKEDDKALSMYEKHVEKHPQDVRAVKKLASMHIRQHRLQPALNLYAKLQAKEHDHYTLENYCLVAKSLDAPEHLLRGLLLTLQTEKVPSAEKYLEISELGKIAKHRDAVIAALEQGHELLPESAVLRVALAQLYLNNDSQVQGDSSVALAAKLLMHPGIYNHHENLSELLAISHQVENKEGILEFLGSDLEAKVSLNIEDKLHLAVLAYQCHQEKRGTDLLASVPHSLENYPDIAQAHCLMGNYPYATELMTSYLDRTPKATSDDWVFLGDLYDLLGQKERAAEAFEYSLQLLTSDLVGNPPPRRVSAVSSSVIHKATIP